MSTTDPLREALERIAALANNDHVGASTARRRAAEIAREALAAAPVEPEYEWRVVQRGGGTYHSVPEHEDGARKFLTKLQRDVPHGTAYVERARKRGPWERVE